MSILKLISCIQCNHNENPNSLLFNFKLTANIYTEMQRAKISQGDIKREESRKSSIIRYRICYNAFVINTKQYKNKKIYGMKQRVQTQTHTK